MDAQRLGQFISAERAAQGMTQKELAEKLGVTDKAVSKWERGVCLPDVAKFDDLAAALGVTVVEVLRAQRLPPEAEKAAEGKAPPLVTRRELARVLLACFLITLVCFACNLIEDWKAMPFHFYGLARLLQIVFCAAASVWLAARAAGNETRSDYRGALRYALIFAAIVAVIRLVSLIVFDGDMVEYFRKVPYKLFGVSDWLEDAGMPQYSVWYREYLDGIWTPKRLLFFYLCFEIFDFPNLQGLLLAFALYPVGKLLRIRRNRKRAEKAEALSYKGEPI